MATMYWCEFLEVIVGYPPLGIFFIYFFWLVPLGAQFFGSVHEFNKEIIFHILFSLLKVVVVF
jgi:hypothetical protein